MLTSEDAVRQISQNNASQVQGAQESASHEEKEDRLFSTLAAFLDEHAGSITGSTIATRVLNLPKVQDVSGKVEVSNLTELAQKLGSVIEAIEGKETEFPDVQKVEGTVTVANQVVVPPTVIPPYPKRTESAVVSLPKYVGETLDAILKALRTLDVKPEVTVDVPAPQVSIDLESIASKLEEVALAVRETAPVEAPEPDFTPMLDALEAIRAVVDRPQMLPPSPKASWDKSFDMRSKDLPLTIHYITHSPSGKKVTDYIQVADGAKNYRRTFTLDTDGDTIAASAWTLQ